MPPSESRSENQNFSTVEAAPQPSFPSSPPHVSPEQPERKKLPISPEVQQMLHEEEYEKELFGRILSGAREEGTSLGELYARATELAVPYKADAGDGPVTPVAADIENSEWNGALDRSGNPRWITLSVPEREEESGVIVPESVLPPPVEPFSFKGGASPKKPGQERLFFRKQTPEPSKTKSELPQFRRPRPLRSCIRMLLVIAVLGMLYHILSQRGWVPSLF